MEAAGRAAPTATSGSHAYGLLRLERGLVTEGGGAARGPRVVRGAALGRLPGPDRCRLGWGLLLGLADAGAEGRGAGLAAAEATLAAAAGLVCCLMTSESFGCHDI